MRASCDLFADNREMYTHRVGITVWHHQPRAFAFGRADGTKNVSPLRSLIMRRTGAGSTFGPTIARKANACIRPRGVL